MGVVGSGIGDDDGLLCVPYDQAEQLLAATHKQQKIEAVMVAGIADGTQDNTRIDAALKRANCTIEGQRSMDASFMRRAGKTLINRVLVAFLCQTPGKRV